MQVSKFAATLCALGVVAASIASAAVAPSNIPQAYYTEIERYIEQRANTIPLGSTQLDSVDGGSRYLGELTMRRGYSAASGPGVDCGACTDPCRSFSLALTVGGGNGRFTGEVCLTSSGWRVRNIAQQTWVRQVAPEAPPPPPVQTRVTYGGHAFTEATAEVIRINLTRLNYFSTATPSTSEVSVRLQEFVGDNGVQLNFSGDAQSQAEQVVRLVTRTNEAVTRSTAPAEDCAPPTGETHTFVMCGRIGGGRSLFQ